MASPVASPVASPAAYAPGSGAHPQTTAPPVDPAAPGRVLLPLDCLLGLTPALPLGLPLLLLLHSFSWRVSFLSFSCCSPPQFDGIRQCVACGTTETPKWRCGMTLCNACGLRNAKRSGHGGTMSEEGVPSPSGGSVRVHGTPRGNDMSHLAAQLNQVVPLGVGVVDGARGPAQVGGQVGGPAGRTHMPNGAPIAQHPHKRQHTMSATTQAAHRPPVGIPTRGVQAGATAGGDEGGNASAAAVERLVR